MQEHGDDVEVRPEDQRAINTFGRLNNRKHDIEDEIKENMRKVTTALLGVDPVYELAATNPVVAAMAAAPPPAARAYPGLGSRAAARPSTRPPAVSL